MDCETHVRPSMYDQDDAGEWSTKSERLGELIQRGRVGNSKGECYVPECARIRDGDESYKDRGLRDRLDWDQEGEIEYRRNTLMVVASVVINLSVDPGCDVARAGNTADLDGSSGNGAYPDEEENHEDQFQLTVLHGHSVCFLNDESWNPNIEGKIAQKAGNENQRNSRFCAGLFLEICRWISYRSHRLPS
jgi:hypothetical protein